MVHADWLRYSSSLVMNYILSKDGQGTVDIV